MKTACANNLKQMTLAVRLWADDHHGVFPPDIVSMSNMLYRPNVLVCPADGRRIAVDWASFGPANCSYDYLAPSANDLEPTRVLFRCPIHGNYALCDGSVQSVSAEAASSGLVQRDGKLYLEFKNP